MWYRGKMAKWWIFKPLFMAASKWLARLAVFIARKRVVEVFSVDYPAESIQSYINEARESWIVAHTAARLDSENVIGDIRLKKIIFPCPKHNPLLTLHAKVLGENEKLLRDGVTDRSKRTKAVVKWTDNAVSESMIIINPPHEQNPLSIGGIILLD